MNGKQHILITGGNGYLGSNIALHLNKAGHQVYALCRRKFDEQQFWDQKGIITILGDLTEDACYVQLEKYTFDTIIHLVSLNHFDSENDPEQVLKVNVSPTWRLLKTFSNKGLKKFIYLSTQQVYGRIPAIEVNENRTPSPVNAYGLTHLQSEQVVNLYREKGIDAVSLRLSNSYGAPVFHENSCWWLVVNDLCQSAFYNHKIKLLSDGSPQRDFIHIDDVAMSILKLTEKEKLENNVYNLSSNITYTILELAFIIQEQFQQRYVELVPVVNSNDEEFSNAVILSEIPKYKIDNYRILKEGINLTTDIRTGINSLFSYFEQQKNK